jgi:hypothetical protein
MFKTVCPTSTLSRTIDDGLEFGEEEGRSNVYLFDVMLLLLWRPVASGGGGRWAAQQKQEASKIKKQTPKGSARFLLHSASFLTPRGVEVGRCCSLCSLLCT